MDSIEQEEERIEGVLEELDGYLADQELRREYRRKEMDATLRVPADRFKELVERINEGVDGLEQKRIEVKDVTRKFIDLQARSETKKELEERYKELLNETDSVDEILRIEKEIQKLRETIESIEGRLRHLKDWISMSTLEVRFYRELERKEGSGFRFWAKFLAAAEGGWHGLQWVLIGLTALWPLWLLLGGGGAILVRYLRRRREKRNS